MVRTEKNARGQRCCVYGKQGYIASPLAKSIFATMSFGMMRRGMSGAASRFMTAPSAVRFAAAEAEAEAVMAGAGINATQEVLGQIADDIVRGRYSDYELAYRSNLENGMTEADAGRNAAYSTLV